MNIILLVVEIDVEGPDCVSQCFEWIVSLAVSKRAFYVCKLLHAKAGVKHFERWRQVELGRLGCIEINDTNEALEFGKLGKQIQLRLAPILKLADELGSSGEQGIIFKSRPDCNRSQALNVVSMLTAELNKVRGLKTTHWLSSIEMAVWIKLARGEWLLPPSLASFSCLTNFS